MASRAAVMILCLGLLLLVAPTPYPLHFVERLRAAQTALTAGRPDLALPPLEQALVREPGLVELRLDVVEVALQADEPAMAQALVAELPARWSQSSPVDCYRAEASARLGDWRNALRWTREAGLQCTVPLTLLREQAAASIYSGQYEPARQLLEGLATLDPLHAETQLRLGLLEAVNRPEAAVSRLIVAAEIEPQFELANKLTAAIRVGAQDGDEAYMLAQVGQTLARAGEWALAAEAFRNALLLEPGYTEARAYLGLALDRSGGDGLAELEQAVSEAPQAALPHQLLGRHWRSRGEPGLALAAFESAAALAPDDPLIAVDLAAAYAANGDLQAATAAHKHAADLSPKDPVVWLLLAQFSVDYEVDIRPLGIPTARRALALQPGSSEALDLLGYAYYLSGDWELAGRFLSRAVHADPRAASPRYHLGLLQLSRGQTAAGVRNLQLASRLDPEGRIGSLAQRSLDNLP